jgi:hypothetical protein
MLPPRIRRRDLLRGAGAALLAAPFFPLAVRQARAQALGTSRRLILWFTPNGTVHRHYRPSGEGADYSFPAGSILEPLAGLERRLLVLDGLDFEHVRGGSHEGGMEHMLTGGGGPSVDQHVASRLGAESPFPSIELSVQTSAWGAGVQTRMCYDASHGYVHPEDNPRNAYARLFAGVSAAAAGAPDAVSPEQLARRSVIDLVRGELEGLRRELGQEERYKLDAHLDSLRRMETRLAGGVTAGAGCEPPVPGELPSHQANDAFPDVGEAQMDLLVAAAACGLSRVLSLQWTHTVSPTIFSWAGASEGHHELSHKDDSNAAGVASFVQTERWFAARFADFLRRLDAVAEPDGTGTLLDTSTVVWVKELGDGRLHDFRSVPFVIAGSGNGYFKTGRYLKLGGVPHQKLLVSLCNSMGLPDTWFGVPDVTGELSELAS